ncbi:meprin A subunit beta isoform X2 [Kryptolebias marmoratus]|uniref:meprin A subunit beta isoform X2 n=1 Tax=Kryptolebias marmoratus TaxID=37003 RepID=UPI0007F911E9|nr:meprin A subunit beta isoform X2 [Kryptolebias marmoratus]
MKSYIFLVVNLIVSSAVSIRAGVDIVDIVDETAEDLLDNDIREPPLSLRSSIVGGNDRWTSPVSYVLDQGLDLNAKGIILRAFDQFRIKSCIDFKPRDSENYYLSIQKLDGCWSYVGRVFANGQDLSIGAGCDSLATVEHEILHALGFHHEQSRYDRDDYVKIIFDNIKEENKHNFAKVGSEDSSTHGTLYDYLSVMHYGKDAFSNGKGSTIITIDPKYQNIIGQRLEMSHSDVQELNLLYKCNSAIAFMFYCDFSNGMCQMVQCSQSGTSWQVVTQVNGGPSSDHTTLPSGNGNNSQEVGYFIHASTASGQEGDSTQLETNIMSPKRECNVQCLQFYYYHSGDESDELNIWIREFQDEQDTTGTLRHMDQITGSLTSHWKLHHVSLNANKQFQVVFQVRKGAGSSTGGFSIDDINISETECPHVTLQIDDLKNRLTTSASGTIIYSPRQYSKEGYAFRVAVVLFQTYVGMYVQLLSGDNDDQLEWPCLKKQMTFQLLDQNPSIQLQMSKQWSFTTSQYHVTSSGTSLWSNPRQTGRGVFYENTELVYGGNLVGYRTFSTLEELQSKDFLKGGSAVFMFSFEDLTPLVNGNILPCPQIGPMSIANPSTSWNKGSCLSRISLDIITPSTTAVDKSVFGFSPGMVASPLLIILLALMFLIP